MNLTIPGVNSGAPEGYAVPALLTEDFICYAFIGIRVFRAATFNNIWVILWLSISLLVERRKQHWPVIYKCYYIGVMAYTSIHAGIDLTRFKWLTVTDSIRRCNSPSTIRSRQWRLMATFTILIKCIPNKAYNDSRQSFCSDLYISLYVNLKYQSTNF